MRKKPDILFSLSLVVIFGAIISHFVVIQPNDKMNNVMQYSSQLKLSKEQQPFIQTTSINHSQELSQEIVHIDSSKKQIH